MVKGLELWAYPSGEKSWKLYYRSPVDGTRRRPKLGSFPTVSIEAARDAARGWLRRVASGEDPSADRQALRDAPTVQDLFHVFDREIVAVRYKAETAAQARGVFIRYVLPALGPKRVSDVNVEDVNRLLGKLGSEAPTMANRCRAYLSKAFSLAESSSRKWRPKGSNPCRDAETISFGERARRRFIRPNEFAALNAELQRLRTAYPWHVALIYVVLYAGGRITEVAKARGRDVVVSSDGVRLEIREHKTDKYVDVRRIRLPVQAWAVIRSLPECSSGYLFGPVGSLKSPRHAIWDVWNQARHAAGCPDVQPRDLRRTFASVAKSRGVSLDQIGELFDHGSTDTTKRYAYLFDDAAHETAQSVGDEIQRLLESPQEGRERPVVPGAPTPAAITQPPVPGLAAKSDGPSRR